MLAAVLGIVMLLVPATVWAQVSVRVLGGLNHLSGDKLNRVEQVTNWTTHAPT